MTTGLPWDFMLVNRFTFQMSDANLLASEQMGFFDYGSGSNRNLLAGEQPETVLASIGAGVRYSISTHLSLRADYGWQLHNAETDRQPNGNVRLVRIRVGDKAWT